MSVAVCSKCGLTYRWGAYRGTRLADHPSPCCNAPGKAVRSAILAPRRVKRCPDCGKAGLQWRKRLRGGDKLPLRRDGQPDWSALYCPRCKKWITPVREVKNAI